MVIPEAAVDSAPTLGTHLHTDEAIRRLPHNTVVISSGGEVFQKYGAQWFVPGIRHGFNRVAQLPATVLRIGDILVGQDALADAWEEGFDYSRRESWTEDANPYRATK